MELCFLSACYNVLCLQWHRQRSATIVPAKIRRTSGGPSHTTNGQCHYEESLTRNGIDVQTQELRKTIADVMTKLHQINSSSCLQQTRLEEEISKVTKRLEELNRSVLDVDFGLLLVNSSMIKTVTDVLTKLQQILKFISGVNLKFTRNTPRRRNFKSNKETGRD